MQAASVRKLSERLAFECGPVTGGAAEHDRQPLAVRDSRGRGRDGDLARFSPLRPQLELADKESGEKGDDEQCGNSSQTEAEPAQEPSHPHLPIEPNNRRLL